MFVLLTRYQGEVRDPVGGVANVGKQPQTVQTNRRIGVIDQNLIKELVHGSPQMGELLHRGMEVFR
jgi:hypothetical protein